MVKGSISELGVMLVSAEVRLGLGLVLSVRITIRPCVSQWNSVEIPRISAWVSKSMFVLKYYKNVSKGPLLSKCIINFFVKNF